MDHILGSINLSEMRNLADPTTRRLTEKTLGAKLRKSEEVVFFTLYLIDSPNTPLAAAKAINWGYQKVYYFNGAVPAWKAAGYPIETGE